MENNENARKPFFEDKWFALAVVALLSLIVYRVSMRAPFIFDDLNKIVQNPDIIRLSNAKNRLVYPYDEKAFVPDRNDPSRPLTYLTFMLNYRFGRLDTYGYHVANVILHILNMLAAFLLARKIMLRVRAKDAIAVPFVLALLYAVHPANTSVVSYISNRSDILASAFYILSLLFFAESFEGRRLNYALSLLCFLLALASKQTAITLPFMVLAFDYVLLSGYDKEEVLKKAYYHAPYWGLALAYLLFRLFYFGTLGDLEGKLVLWSREYYSAIQPYVVLRYIGFLLVPAGQSFYHALKPLDMFTARAVISLLAVIGIFALLYRIYTLKKSGSGIVLFSALWFFAALSPTSSFFSTANPMVENRMYLASFGFYLLAAFGYISAYNWLSARKPVLGRLLIGVIIVHVIALSAAAVKRNRMYNDPIGIWKEVVNKYPDSIVGHNNLGACYYNQKMFFFAMQEFKKVLELNPMYTTAHNDLANLYRDMGVYDKALNEYQAALSLDPNSSVIHQNLANLYYQQKNYFGAAREYDRAIRIDPNYVEAYNNLAVMYFNQKKYDEAVGVFNKALEINPDYADTYNNLGLLYFEKKDYDKAVEEYRRVLSIYPGNIGALCMIGYIYSSAGKYDEAIAEYSGALRLAPRNAGIYNNIGIACRNKGDYAGAIGAYGRALEISPNYPAARQNLGDAYFSVKDYEKALKEYEIAVKLAPSDAGLKDKLGETRKLLGKKQ